MDNQALFSNKGDLQSWAYKNNKIQPTCHLREETESMLLQMLHNVWLFTWKTCFNAGEDKPKSKDTVNSQCWYTTASITNR